MNTTIQSAMRENGRGALRGLAVFLSLIVYLAALVYAGVRSYDLFARTIDPAMLPLALLGIIALEVTALALPLAIHFWTAPGPQRLAAWAFYGLDLALIVGNSILDAAYYSGSILPSFMQAYGTWVVPALPVVCMIGWAVVWMLDPATREHDMRAAVRAATQEALMSRIVEETAAADIGEEVKAAAAGLAREIVGETLGRRVESRMAAATGQPPSGDQAPATPGAVRAAGIVTLPAVAHSLNGTHVEAPAPKA